MVSEDIGLIRELIELQAPLRTMPLAIDTYNTITLSRRWARMLLPVRW